MKDTLKWSVAALSLFLLGLVSGRALAGQPHMKNALDALNMAQTELQKAEDNKGGHRVKALNLVNQARAEVQAGIQYAR